MITELLLNYRMTGRFWSVKEFDIVGYSNRKGV